MARSTVKTKGCFEAAIGLTDAEARAIEKIAEAKGFKTTNANNDYYRATTQVLEETKAKRSAIIEQIAKLAPDVAQEYSADVSKPESAIDAALRSVGIDPSAPVDKAIALRREAEKIMKESRRMLDGIPAGQPIHSTADRNLRERAMEKARKATALYEKADSLDAGKLAQSADTSESSRVPVSTDATGKPASWVIRDKSTGAVVMETFDPKKVEALNTEKYEAVPIAEHLASLNQDREEHTGGWSERINNITQRPVYGYNPHGGAYWATVQNPSNGVYQIEYHKGSAALESDEITGTLLSVKLHVKDRIDKLQGVAVHSDDGQAPAIATPEEVGKSMQKAAQHEDKKPSEMRKWLLGEIDKAIANAPGESADPVRELREAQARKFIATADIKRLGQSGINRAEKEFDRLKADAIEKASRQIGYITFDVPGDGKFKVVNSEQSLKAFRTNVEGSPGFKDKQSAPVVGRTGAYGEPFGVERGSGTTAAAIKSMIDDGDPQAAVDYAAAKGVDVAEVLKNDKKRLDSVAGLEATQDAPVQADDAMAPNADTPANDRDHFTLERLNHETNQMEPVTFSRGEYVRYSLGHGEIDGISQARREFSVDGLWYPFGYAYKAEKPEPAKPDTVPLSSVIDAVNKKHGAGLTDADAVKAPQAVLDAETSLWSRITDGAATVEEFKAGFENWVSRKAEIVEALSKIKKDDLLKMGGSAFAYRYKSENKPEIVDALWREGASAYTLARSFSYSMGKSSYIDAIRNLVDGTDAERLAEYAKDRKTAQEQAVANVSKIAEAIKDPKTLGDYQAWMRATMGGGKTFKEARMLLTPDQRAQFDELTAEDSRSKRKATKDEQRTSVAVAGQTVDGNIIATKHTKKGHDVFVVQLAERISKEDYDTLNAGAKRIGGYYSSYRGAGATPGFQFTERAQAEAFVKLAQGDNADAQAAAQANRDAFEDDRSQTAVQRLTEMADRLDGMADASLGHERKQNTERRARQAASAEAAANSEKAMAKTMRNIASAIEAGTAKFLDRVRQKVQVAMLQGYIATAKGDELRAKYPNYSEQERHKGEAPTAETADFATYPTYTASRSDLAALARQLLEVDGTKLLGQRLLKEADDVSDAYLAFAKENFAKVASFRAKDGGLAGFSTKAAAEASIARSGYKGKAIAYQVKRGEHTVILSPSEAIDRGIWQGDGDKRITLHPDTGAELVEKIGKAARRGAKVSVPWQLETAHDRRKALSRMGIETPAEFRAALREFIGLQERPQEASKVKQLERAMVGKRNDGLDFFPTPESVADEMVTTAGIEPGMAVLEPSAGWGHIAERIRAAGVDPDVGEMASDRRELLEAKGFNLVGRDFMEMSPRGFTYGDVFRAPDGTLGVMRGSGGLGSNQVGLDPLDASGQPDKRISQWHDRDTLVGVEKRGGSSGYDRILMNPPFSDGRDIQHVQHAYTLLKPGGRIVAIMGESAFTNQNKRATEFRAWLEKVGGTEEKLDEGTFNDPSLPVNTGANARMVVIDRADNQDGEFQGASESETNAQEAPAFSRAPTQPGRGLEAFAQMDDLYALPKSTATDIKQIARDNEEDVKVRTTNLGSEKMHTLTFDNGTTIRITERKANPYGQDQQIYAMELEDGNSRMSQIGRPGENPEDVPPTDDVWLDVSQNIPAKYGAIAYNIAATYAYNNGKIFIGDPAGLSDMALRRRTEQMLSSALKFGTTEHLAPHPRQVAGDVSLGVPPLKWIYGDHVGNIERMIDVSLESLENGAPGAKDDTRYDPSTGGFTDKSGQVVPRKSSMGRDMASYRAGIDKAQAGWRTYARSAFLRSFLGANGRAEGSGILDRAINDVSRISSNGVGGGAYPRTERIFYSRDGANGSKPTSTEPRSAENSALDLSRVTSIVDAIRATWKNAPEIVVASSMHDAVIPERVRSYNDEQMSLGATGDPQGFVYGGKVYLVADQLSTPGHVLEVLFHEALGHVGLRGVFGDSLKQVLNQVVLARRADVRAKAAQYGFAVNNEDEMRRAAEEVLAEMAQTYPELGIVQRAIAAIRTWLRTHIPQLQAMKLTDAEIVRNFILPARAFVERGSNSSVGGMVAFARRDDSGSDIPSVIIGNPIGSGKANEDYQAAKAGDIEAAVRLAKVLVTPDLLTKIKSAIKGYTPVVVGVFSIEATGRNQLPNAAAGLVAEKLGLEVGEDIIQSSSPKRTTMNGLDRIFNTPEFDGTIEPGRSYLLIDDTVTQGATFAALASHIKDGGGKIAGVVALTGKEYSSTIKPSPETLSKLREKYADLESTFKASTGYGFDGLTQSEARYLANFEPAVAVRNRIIEAGQQAVDSSNTGTAGELDSSADSGDADIRFSRSATMSATANKVVEKLNEHFSHAGTMSWWHKSFGSPYNLAQKSRPFKRVFTSAQDFLNDVSFYANEAADHASNLLPKLESWKDIGKSPISAADNKAIEAPIFEGTLSWARDEAGKAVKVADLEEKYADLSDEQKAGMLLRKRIVTEAQLKRWKASQLDIYSGAIRNRFEATFLRPGVVWSDAELKSIFNLTPEQADLYRQFHAAVGTSLDNLAKSEMLRYGGDDVADLRDMVLDAPTADDAAILLRDHLLQLADEDQSRADILTDMANGMVDRADKVNKLKKEGYAPLSRFGQYSVDVVVDGDRQYFGLFETKADANQMADKLRKEYGAENVESGTMAQQKFELYKGITPESLELFGNMLGLDSTGDKESDKVFQEYLKLTKNNRSAMKRLIHRQGIAGYSTDTGRVLAAFIYSNARQTAAGLHMGEMADAVNAIPKVEGQLSDYATRYADYVKNPQEEAQAIRGLMFAQYLGGNVASAFVNFTQPMTVSFPYLSQFAGIKGAAAALGRAMADQRTGEYEKDLLEALRIADEQGVTQPQSVHELQAQARGAATLRPGDGTRRGDAVAMASNALSKLSLGWGKLFGMAEQVNRRTTFIAAYRIAVEKGLPNPGAFATKAVDETQFINNKGNKAVAGRGAVGSTLMTFKSYSINYMELLHRMGTKGGPEGKRAVALAMAMLFLMAGAGGLPFVDDLDDLIDGIAQRMGYNFSSKKAKQEFLEHVFGKAGAQFVDRGITGIAGIPIDVAGRMGMGNLLPGTGLFMPKADHTSDMSEFLGVIADLGKRASQAGGQFVDGRIHESVMSLAPKAVSNLDKGLKMMAKGYYEDAKGAKVIDTTPTEAVFKMAGFQPQSVALVGQSNWINQSAKNLYTLNAQAIRAQWAKGIFENDPDQVNDARERMRSWNEKNPGLRIDPNMPAIIKKVREMRKTKEERIADTAPKAMRAQLRKEIAESHQP